MMLGGRLSMVAVLMATLFAGGCLSEEDADELASIEQASCMPSGAGCISAMPPLYDLRSLPVTFDLIPATSHRFHVLYERATWDASRFVAYGVDVTNQKVVWRITAQ